MNEINKEILDEIKDIKATFGSGVITNITDNSGNIIHRSKRDFGIDPACIVISGTEYIRELKK